MSSPGDWMCGACNHINFKKRDLCQKCEYSKYGGPIDMSTYSYINKGEMIKPGDWYCSAMNCGAHNYAGRSSCYRCGGIKNDFYGGGGGAYGATTNNSGGGGGGLPGWKTGDWICIRAGCSMHNYACRMECYKCKTPRE